jgi:hypothetical protein
VLKESVRFFIIIATCARNKSGIESGNKFSLDTFKFGRISPRNGVQATNALFQFGSHKVGTQNTGAKWSGETRGNLTDQIRQFKPWENMQRT